MWAGGCLRRSTAAVKIGCVAPFCEGQDSLACVEGEALSLSNPKPIRNFTPEEQEIIEQILDYEWDVKVYELPDESLYHVSCHFRFPHDKKIDRDLPITTRGQTRTDALNKALADVIDRAND